MISKKSFEVKHIKEIQDKSKRDPILIERAIYAFGLLEALVKSGLPFIFKGGTCLMLLLSMPKRLSTDIDIVVKPGIDIEKYIDLASNIFPFKAKEENVRYSKSKIIKRHFKFTYDSPVSGRPFYILLDILFENNHYEEVIKKEIKMDMLIMDGEPLNVDVPSVDCILGDKLTAFAPHTIGITISKGKDMEIMKQMYDISTLINSFKDFNKVSKTYHRICEAEIAYRGNNISEKDCLLDTFFASACVAGKSKIMSDDYSSYIKGIRELRSHIYTENYSGELAAIRAPQIMYMAMCILLDNEFKIVVDYKEYMNKYIQSELLKPLKYLKKVDLLAYAYVIKADELYVAFQAI